MPTDTLTAKANVGAGTDGLAGRNTAQGFVGAVFLTDASGADIGSGNPLPVTGTFWQATQPVSFTWAGLTDAQLRASAVPVSGTVNVNKQATTASAPTTATVGVASGAALALNANRKGAYLKNTSTTGQRISLAFSGGTAVLDSGITLEVGDAYFMGEYDFTTGAINAIASAAGARLSVQEWA